MNKDFFTHNLKAIAMATNQINEQTNLIRIELCTIFGLFESDNDFTDFNHFQIKSPPNNVSSGFDNQMFIMEELKQMIIKLSISGSIRTRKNGLIELRTQAFGSIYGRTKDEIEKKLNKKIKEEQKNKLSKTKKALFLSEFFTQHYLPYKQTNLAENSIKAIKSSFKNFVEFDKPINKYTAMEIEKFLFSVPQTRKRQVLQGLLNNILTYAKRLEFIKSNPCDNVEKMKHTKKIGRALSFDDQCAFFNSLYSPTSKTTLIEKQYLTFVYLTGTRRNEALSITGKDILLEKNILHIPGTKTKNSNRTIPMFPLVKKLLSKMVYGKSEIFDLSYNHIKKTIEKTESEYHLHELRHTFGTIGICVQKLDPKTVSLYMGHSDPFTTLNTYTHPEQLDEKLFYDGSLSDNEKLEKLKEKYAYVLSIIDKWLDSLDQ